MSLIIVGMISDQAKADLRVLTRATALVAGVFALAASTVWADEEWNRLENPGFERPLALDWKLFVPPESAHAGCSLAPERADVHSGRQACAIVSSNPARFALMPHAPLLHVRPGERYRLAAWVKADPTFRVEASSPGVLLRATLLATPTTDAPGGHWFIGFAGVAHAPVPELCPGAIPTAWTKLEGVVEIPEGARYLGYFVFVWKGSGRVLVDDVELVPVAKSVPATRVLAAQR